MKRFTNIIACGTLLLATASCTSPDRELEQVLEFAGSRRAELEQVLNHYADDSLKREAARYLIVNMPGAFGADPSVEDACEPFFAQYDSLMQVHGYDALLRVYGYSRRSVWEREVDSLWEQYSRRHFDKVQVREMQDLQTVSAQRLITEIDQSFEAWRSNVYTRHCSFQDFCEYILPYRRKNGLVIDSARQVFYARHRDEFFRRPGKEMIAETDSLLHRYLHISHSAFAGTKIPLRSAYAFEKLRHGLCEHRCWYNSLLLSSLGMEVAIDFVPAWGNRNNSHTWNVLIKEGESYAFEPFWDNDRWKYKRIYNNRSFDEVRGRFRLPKVFRHTYSRRIEGPMADPRVPREDIPALFRNIRKKDVSHEYFDTACVNVELENIPEGTRYAYLCVLNYGEWDAVQWGRIEKGKATFEGMGKDILYLPMYCRAGVLQPAGKPFYLKQNGSREVLQATGETETIVVHHYNGAPAYEGNRVNHPDIEGTVLLGGETPNNLRDTLCTLEGDIELNSLLEEVKCRKPVRFVRMVLPRRKVALGRLEFFGIEQGDTFSLPTPQFVGTHPLSEKQERADAILDRWSSTGYKQDIPQGYMDIDLGKPHRLSGIRFCPYMEGRFLPEAEYELCYWDDGWKSLGKKPGDVTITYDSVPRNALLLLRTSNNTRRVGSRPFIYRNNEIYWL